MTWQNRTQCGVVRNPSSRMRCARCPAPAPGNRAAVPLCRDAAHLLVAGEQTNARPRVLFQNLEIPRPPRRRTRGLRTSGRCRRHVQQALGRVIEVAGHDQLARVSNPRRERTEVEIVTHRERRRVSTTVGITAKKTAFSRRIAETSMGCGLQVDTRAAALDEIYGRRIVGLHPAPQPARGIRADAVQRTSSSVALRNGHQVPRVRRSLAQKTRGRISAYSRCRRPWLSPVRRGRLRRHGITPERSHPAVDRPESQHLVQAAVRIPSAGPAPWMSRRRSSTGDCSR